MRTSSLLLLVCMLALCAFGICEGGPLRKKFYKSSCPNAEEIIKTVVWKRVAQDSGLPAALVRMHFHDCFVRGCDGSVLLNSTKDNTAEKDAPPNLTLTGFDVIDEVKTEVEKACPGVVSCADIVALSARDSVAFQFKKPLWDVLTGRRDGTLSRASEAVANLPQPTFDFNTLKQNFARQGLNVHDLVVLSGAHTIGQAHCNAFSNRLYNFTGKGDADPSLDPTYAAVLRTQCKSLSDNTAQVFMDPNSGTSFDSHYYAAVKQHKGLFQSDAALLTNKITSNIVTELLNQNAFFTEFAQSIQKMGAIGVLTGNSGQIRKICSVVNP
ncbi:PREDICTED: peroxidase 3-like [Nelumbo nucifera]|uniref:Peroxidase n=2 Tax=Nelumbo nucifera TaxID=4432 RepID=A0A822ZF04_NELNU|nr:PREDICTED: peroxidase 3-like [Nelumbo nucifera]DAD40178.1 TPA_asm: hypothetical protein HUJ06_014501 [Nelumbo nucifera]